MCECCTISRCWRKKNEFAVISFLFDAQVETMRKCTLVCETLRNMTMSEQLSATLLYGVTFRRIFRTKRGPCGSGSITCERQRVAACGSGRRHGVWRHAKRVSLLRLTNVITHARVPAVQVSFLCVLCCQCA